MKRLLLIVLSVLILEHAPWRLAALLCEVPFVSVTETRFSDHTDRYWDAQNLQQQLERQGWTIHYGPLQGGISGLTYSEDRTIWVDDRLAWNGRLAVLAHESGHTQHPSWVTHNQGEAYAEMVAALLAHDGLREHARFLARMRADTFLLAITEWRSLYRTADLYASH